MTVDGLLLPLDEPEELLEPVELEPLELEPV